jgi:hypothetical protein
MRIAILQHATAPDFWRSRYLLRPIAEVWAERGIQTTAVYGADDAKVDADLCIVHVDLTAVPDEYLALAQRCGVVLNGRVRDTSKSAIGEALRVSPGDGWQGPVIVKTDLNFGGQMEEWVEACERGPAARLALRLRRRIPARLGGPLDPHAYPTYRSAEEVPARVWSDPRLVVHRFLPERRDDLFCLRCWIFFGDQELNVIAFSEHPIVKASSTVRRENLGPPPAELRSVREQLGFDYGKFDYGIVDGEVVLYDVNPAPTVSRHMAQAERRRIGALLAEGLRAFVPGGGLGR